MGAGRKTVLLEDIGKDIDLDVLAQRTGPAFRHGIANLDEQICHRAFLWPFPRRCYLAFAINCRISSAVLGFPRPPRPPAAPFAISRGVRPCLSFLSRRAPFSTAN